MKNTLFDISIIVGLIGIISSCNLEEVPDNSIPNGGALQANKFVTIVGSDGTDFPNEAINTSDKGFIIAGYSAFTNDVQAYLVKLDSKGIQSWEAHVGDPTTSEIAESVIQTADGGFVLCGSSNDNVFLAKINALGSKVWTKTFGSIDSSETAFAVVPMNVSDFIIAYLSHKQGSQSVQLKIMQINSNGVKLSNKLIRNGKFVLSSMIRTSDGDLLATGSETAEDNNANDRTYTIKFSENGNFKWENSYPFPSTYHTPSYDVVELPNKSFAVAGNDHNGLNDFNIVSFNQIGGKIWHKTWGGASDDSLRDIALSKDNQLIVMGYTYSFSNEPEIYISKRRIDDGEKIWERSLNPFAVSNGWECMATSSDGGYLLVSRQNKINADIGVVKTNENGEYK